MLDPQPRRGPIDSAAAGYMHSRTRTTSSSVFPPHPTSLPPQQQYRQYHGQQQQPPPPPQRQQPQYAYESHHLPRQRHPPPNIYPNAHYADRSASMNTLSTTSTGGPPFAYHAPSTDIRRSSSSRSGDQPTSYVAALRRQKGTVWCDRAQPEDPALAAQLRAAKMRAARTMAAEMGKLNTGPRNSSGRAASGISTTGKVAAKIRHHGKQAVVGYAPGENHVGVGGVPPRLSATEVEGESTDEEDAARGHPPHHRRTGSSSGRSSTGSGRRPIPYRGSGPSGSQRGTPSRQGSLAESVAERQQQQTPLVVVGAPSDAASGEEDGKAQSVKSGSSGAERADNVGELERDPKIASKSRLAADSAKDKAGLERRGSVDERTMTLSAGRLFIANPD